MPTRRTFLKRSALATGGALALNPLASATAQPRTGLRGPVPDPAGVIDLPKGFRYRIVQTVEDKLSNGAPVPGDFDGMAVVGGGRGRPMVLVRNHELRPGDISGSKAAVEGKNPYDAAAPGGTTALVVGPDRRLRSSVVGSAGTLNNCAGGGTPWGTWITCEEDRTSGHGYAFEVDPRDPDSALSKTPIRAMGFFSHEAIDIDPRTGVAYLTEDDFRGDEVPTDAEVPGTTRSSFLFRYLPDDRSPKPGALQRGGKLQALAIKGEKQFNMDLGKAGDTLRVAWVDVNPEEPHDDALEHGAARFQRLEGCEFAAGSYWFSDTSGGEARLGQIYRLRPSGRRDGGGRDTLELVLESDAVDTLESPDNVTVTPWGDLWVAEDGDGEQRVIGITPDGKDYLVARNALNDKEFAGPCFSPDGRTFFVNIQDPGHTLAIWGPFPKAHAGRRRQLATAAPRHRWAPKLSGELREQAARHAMSPYQAAAFERLGAPLAS